MPLVDDVYLTGIGSTGDPPNYSQDDRDKIEYTFIALRPCTTTIKPYNEVASGNAEKYSGDYDQAGTTIAVESLPGGLTLSKSVSPETAEAGDTLTWTITYGNSTDYDIGDPATGNGLVVVDQEIPDHTTYVAGSASCSGSCAIFFSTDSGTTWTATEPVPAGDVTTIKWHINEVIPADTPDAGWVSFQTTVDEGTPVGTPICNTAWAMIDEGDPLVADTVCANAPPPSATIEATKSDSLDTDAAPTGPSPGDTLLYTIIVSNTSGIAADNVTYHDIIESNLTLVVGSVTTTQGTVISGNTSGDTDVEVDFGTIAVSASVTITFKATVASPLPEGVTQVANQGLIDGSNFPTALTDDPDTPASGDETVTPITAAPDVEAYKESSLAVDADGNGFASPGDTMEYTVTVMNSGNQDGEAAVLVDPIDTNTALVVGSVTASQGAVIKGNSPGDAVVQVDLGTLSGGGGTATITFSVTIDDPLPAGVEQVSDQGVVSGSNFPGEPTDDPSTPGDDDATIPPVTSAPQIQAYKRASLLVDADEDGAPSPGDTLLYNISIINDGNQEAGGVVFSDTPDGNTALVVGSVVTSQGAVTSGNSAGDSSVEVNIGNIPGGGGSVSISFEVTINSNSFAQVENQGEVSGINFMAEPTDDPDTAAEDDSTITPVTSAPFIEVSKTDILFDDADSNGVASPGDALMYVISIVNSGNATAADVTFSDAPDANTTLVVGSVSTSQGTVTSGNSAGDTAVEVDLGSIPSGESRSISFQAVINSDGFSEVTNQGTVSGDNFPGEPTDDPDTLDEDDATKTQVSSPLIEATKEGILLIDADGDGMASPGDTLQYAVGIRNDGTATAIDVTFSDTVDPNTSLVCAGPDAPTSTQGSVTGCTPGAGGPLTIYIGDISPGASVTVTFCVTINPDGFRYDYVFNQGVVSGSNFLSTPTNVVGVLVKAPPVPPEAVGGEAYPSNKLAVVMPWLILLAAITGVAAMLLKRRRAQG